jgi:hypothetical protein
MLSRTHLHIAAPLIVCMLWNVYSISAAPLPQSSDVAAPPANASVDGLTDPFTAPNYLGKTLSHLLTRLNVLHYTYID